MMAFRGSRAYLSNFYHAPFTFAGKLWPTVEHAFQAAKTLHPDLREKIRSQVTPGEAKALGRVVELRNNWEQIKVTIMGELLQEKFIQHHDLGSKLLATGNEELIEYNTWHDNIWGDCTCAKCAGISGENLLGKLLMETRRKLRGLRGAFDVDMYADTGEQL